MSVDSQPSMPTGAARQRYRPALAAADVLWLLVLLAAVLVPVLFSPWHNNAFELPKALTSRALGGLALLALIYLPGARQVKKWTAHALALPLLVLAASLVAATFFSIDAPLSLWGSYDRQFGLLTWLAPLALCAAALAALHSRARQEFLQQLLIWSSTPVLIYALLQLLGADPFAWSSDGASAALGTLGRSNFLGSYLVLIIPLTATALWVTSRSPAAVRRWPLALLLAGQLIVLVLTRARAAYLGLLGAAATFGLLWLLIRGRGKLAGRLALLGLLLLAILLVLASVTGLPAALSEGGSTAARLTIWRATLPLIAGRPLLGYGPDAMQEAFQGVFPPELVYYQGRHLAVDRAHNLWLDLAMSAGLLGLAAFLFLLWRAGRLMWHGLRHGPDMGRRMLLAGVASAVAGHLVELQLSLETVATAVVFWLLLALGAAAASEPAAAGLLADLRPSRPWSSLPLALAFAVLLGMLTVRPLLADHAYWLGLRQNPGSAAALSAFVEAKRQWPIEPTYQVALAQSYWTSSQPAAAASEAVSAAQSRPEDARLWAAAGDILARWGTTEPEHYAEALAAYRRALDLSPNTAAYYTALGLILAESGRLEEGIAAVEQAVALDATDAVAYGHLASLYSAAGQPEKAGWATAQAQRWSGKAAGPGP